MLPESQKMRDHVLELCRHGAPPRETMEQVLNVAFDSVEIATIAVCVELLIADGRADAAKLLVTLSKEVVRATKERIEAWKI
jgi:hypothetical protein